MAARANVLEDEKGGGLIARGHNVVRAIKTLRPDSSVDDEAILNGRHSPPASPGLIC
jgi:hypothetical protein